MAKKKNRPFRSGSTQHYEEKLLKPFGYKQTQEDNVLTDLEISWFFFGASVNFGQKQTYSLKLA